MTTNQVGPLVAGQDEEKVTAASGPARDAGEIRESVLLNLGYFWFGRFGGVLAYFFPALVAIGLFLVVGPRDRVGWLCVVAIALSWLAYIRVIPDNWYGGGGTIGNRYFLGILPRLPVPGAAAARAWLALAGVLATRRLPGAGARIPDPALARSRDATRSRRPSGRCRPSSRC